MTAEWDEIMNHIKAGGKLRRGMTRDDLVGQETEVWHGMGGRTITAPKGTFEAIYNSEDDDEDI